MSVEEGDSKPLDPADEARLVVACQAGDKAAASALVDMHWERVFFFSFGLVRNQVDAEDLTQETFLRAFKSIQEYEPSGLFKSWLFRIASNLFLDNKKSSRNRRMKSMDAMSQPPASPGNQDESVSLIHRELYLAIQQEISELPAEQQTIVNLRVQGGMDYARISEIMGMQEGTVRWHMHEIRTKLRQKLVKRFDMEDISI